MKKIRQWLAALIAISTAVSPAFALEDVTLSVSKIKGLNLRIYGFVETDAIADTTQAFTEEEDNNLIPKRFGAGGVPNFAGQFHRTELSIRNSRLGFDLTVPKTDSGWQGEGVLELDLLGNQGINTNPGAASTTQSEVNFFNNSTVRVRHAYLNLTYKDDTNFKVGQYWSLLGWQPYYFPGEVIVQPGPAQLYRRFAQMRAMETMHLLDDSWTLETAADIARPAEMNSGSPITQAGLRFASTKIKGASTGGAGTQMVGLSAAVSADIIPLTTQSIGKPTGEAVAVNTFVPIIASTDGKDRSNNLIWLGEFMTGQGVGGLEYPALSLGVPQVTAATPNAGTTIDTGIAGLDAQGNAEMIRYQAFRTNLEYSLPGGQWAVSTGYAQIRGMNLDRFSTTAAVASAIAPKIQFGYASLFYDPLNWLRFGAEFNQTRDTYNDASNRYATNNRFQFTTWFIF